MADDKKNIPEAAPPAEAPAPAVENAVVPEQPAPEPALTDAEVVMLEHEGQAALFEMGEAVPDPADAVTHTEVEEPAAPEVPKAEKEQEQPPTPGKDTPAPAHSGKVVDFAAARDEAAKEEIFTELAKDYVSGVTFSGGDPLYPANREHFFRDISRRSSAQARL